MQTPEFFGYVSADLNQFKQQSKEIFFSTKRHAKRLKINPLPNDRIEKNNSQDPNLDLSFDSNSLEKQLKTTNSELQSTFGDDNALTFKTHPPKRKTHLSSKAKTCQKLAKLPQSESEFDSILTKSASIQRHKLYLKKSNQMPSIQQGVSNKEYKITDFLILHKLGSGTYSEVYMVVEKKSGFVCALKILQKHKMIDMKVQENTKNQIKIQSFLNHPNISKLYGCFHDQEYIYLICQCATDQNLFDVLRQPSHNTSKLSPRNQVPKIIGQLCNAVEQIHRHSVIHRDIKPENILLTMYNTIKICDFGWSIYNPKNLLRSTLCGTPLYLAPQLLIQSQYNQSIDIWAIGILTYELLTQQNPFNIQNVHDLQKILYEEISYEKIDNILAIDFLQKTLQKNHRKRKSIHQLALHPYLIADTQN